jgi:hypothetical protein
MLFSRRRSRSPFPGLPGKISDSESVFTQMLKIGQALKKKSEEVRHSVVTICIAALISTYKYDPF